MQKRLRKIMNWFGYDIINFSPNSVHNALHSYPPDFSKEDIKLVERVKEFTMTSPERIVGLRSSVEYVVKNKIEGSIVECGVWRGGSSMAAIYTLLEMGDTSRSIYLYDTFSGMVEPTEVDIKFTGNSAADLLSQVDYEPGKNLWCWATLDEVRQNVLATGYPEKNIHFIEGDILQTIPKYVPEKISLLRLDTDWYESTKHELLHLYPNLDKKGVLIVDDYGHWQGSKKAVDEYMEELSYKPLLQRVDYTGRCLVKY